MTLDPISTWQPTMCGQCGEPIVPDGDAWRHIGDAQPRHFAVPASEWERIKAQQPTPNDRREYLGRIVRDVWVKWASEQPNPKPHHLDPWEVLPPEIQEVDRRIGEAIERTVQDELLTLLRQCRPWLPAVERELRDAVRQALGEEV